jgi:hypothetical protein
VLLLLCARWLLGVLLLVCARRPLGGLLLLCARWLLGGLLLLCARRPLGVLLLLCARWLLGVLLLLCARRLLGVLLLVCALRLLGAPRHPRAKRQRQRCNGRNDYILWPLHRPASPFITLAILRGERANTASVSSRLPMRSISLQPDHLSSAAMASLRTDLYQPGHSPHLIKIKNPDAAAVKRKAEEHRRGEQAPYPIPRPSHGDRMRVFRELEQCGLPEYSHCAAHGVLVGDIAAANWATGWLVRQTAAAA